MTISADLIGFNHHDITSQVVFFITLADEATVSWGPTTYKEEPHICARRADYSLLFGEKDHLACYVVMVEANQVYMSEVGHDHLRRLDWLQPSRHNKPGGLFLQREGCNPPFLHLKPIKSAEMVMTNF
jgi:hypothetical protein